MKVNFGIAEKLYRPVVEQLHVAVANTYALYLLTLQCHWNLEDPGFLFLHEMLQEQYEKLAENGDLLAERIRQMGEKVPISPERLQKKQTFAGLSEEADCRTMLDHLASCHEQIIRELRALSKLGEGSGDFGLVDLLGSILRDHEKSAWILRSHL